MKKCSKCGVEKSLDEFFRRGRGDQKHSWCKVCHRACTKKWELKNHDRWKAIYTARNEKGRADGSVREWNLKRKYGLTNEDWEKLFDKQGRKCAICQRSDIGKLRWQVDHNHETNAIRGILCGTCNRFVLPIVEFNEDFIPRVLDYLKQ